MKQYQFILTYNAVSTELDINPAGWNEIGVNFIRNTFYHSVLRNMALTLRFARKTGGGADIILNAYDNDDISAIVDITINRRNPATNGYVLFYKGVLDLKPGKFTIETDFVEAGIMDGMKEQKFISRDTINYNLFSNISTDNIEVDAFTTPYKTITFTPIDIFLKTKGTCDVASKGQLQTNAPDPNAYTYLTNPSYSENAIGDRVTFDNTSTVWTNTTDSPISLTFELAGSYNIKVRTQGLTAGDYVDVYYNAKIYNESNVLLLNQDIVAGRVHDNETFENFIDTSPNVIYVDADQSTIYLDDLYPYMGHTKYTYVQISDNIDFEMFQANVPANGYLAVETIYIINDPDHSSSIWVQSGSVEFTIQEQSPGKANTTARCLFPHEAFTRLVQLQTSELDTAKLFYSTFFGRTNSEFQTYASNGSGAYDAITAGRLIRNYPNEPLTVSMRDLFKSFDSVYNLGLGYDRVNDRFYIERKNKFYDSSYFMFNLGEVAELKITPLEEGYFNKILGGFEYQGEYEDFQGAFEFNLQREYSLSTPVKEDADYRSKYNFDSVGIELARRKQYIDNASKDTRYDKYVYIVKTDGTNPVLGNFLEGFQGIDQYYNTMLSPRANLLRWGNVLKAALYKNSNPVKFQSASKVFTMTKDGVNEFADITQDDINDEPLFIPKLYSFESLINTDILAILNTNPHGYIQFTYEGTTYQGYIKEIKTGDYNKKATYELFAKEVTNVDNFLFEDGDNFLMEDGDNFIFE